MILSFGSLLILLPLLIYFLHGLWRIVACDSLVVALSACFAYLIAATLFRGYLPTLPLVPVWLPFLYAYLWLSITALLVFTVSGKVGRKGLGFVGLSRKMACYLSSHLALAAGVMLLNPLLTDRPLQAFMTLPPFVAVAAYVQYQLFCSLADEKARLPWWLIVFSMITMPLALAWTAEVLVPLLLRYL